MSHNHSHDDHHGHCNHDDTDHLQLDGTLDFLYKRIDKDHVVALNAAEGSNAGKVIRPYNERDTSGDYLESDADEQLILQISFTGSVKLRSILIKCGPAEFTPDVCQLFSNQRYDFDQASSAQATQKVDIAATNQVVEYTLSPAKFSNVQHLTLFFPSNMGADTTRIDFIGFRGEYSALTRDPIITVYEAQANPADHAKIPGLDSGAHARLG